MRGPRRFRPSPAMVVASIALLVALGGTSWAAMTLAPRSVTNAALKTGAVNSRVIADHQVKNVDLAAGVIKKGPSGPSGASGPTGAGGPSGPSGPSGASGNNSLVAFANVNGTGASPSIRSFGGQGTTGASVASCGAGCFDVTFTGSYPGATSKDKIASFATADTDFFDWASTSLNASPVPTTTSITIRVWTLSASAPTPHEANRDFAVEILVA
jgi:hypothetical protein